MNIILIYSTLSEILIAVYYAFSIIFVWLPSLTVYQSSKFTLRWICTLKRAHTHTHTHTVSLDLNLRMHYPVLSATLVVGCVAILAFACQSEMNSLFFPYFSFFFALHFCSLHFEFEFIWHFNERIMSAWHPWQPWQSLSQVDDTYNSQHMRLLHVRCPTETLLCAPPLPLPCHHTHTLLQLSNWVTHFGSCHCTWIFWAVVALVHVRHKNLNYLSAQHTYNYTYTGPSHTHTQTSSHRREERAWQTEWCA